MVLRDGKMQERDGRQAARIISKLWTQDAKNSGHPRLSLAREMVVYRGRMDDYISKPVMN